MRGIVVHHEHRIGFIVIRELEGGVIVARLNGNYVAERGDAISGDLNVTGNTVLLNETNGQTLSVEIQDGIVTEKDAIELIVKTVNR
ncbi:hypothetical protein PCO82_11955 [Pectobacteriaceae bacterium CE90]|nr:hypothetical protein [Prodigiosinella sp. LS101]WJV55629.1 hypothetical protein PCO85_09695 [Prodigiosinella sp. LS101]WJV59990.1 hypothetical protein PCO84_09700 [Pectobacteriaceae bacterium C111]WJY13307.1 hypothetical protein PCO82_11955 [Pectobacteriaceae bacterium CE90]